VRRQDLRLANDAAAAPLGVQQQQQQGRAAGLQTAAVVERVTQTVLAKMLEVSLASVTVMVRVRVGCSFRFARALSTHGHCSCRPALCRTMYTVLIAIRAAYHRACTSLQSAMQVTQSWSAVCVQVGFGKVCCRL